MTSPRPTGTISAGGEMDEVRNEVARSQARGASAVSGSTIGKEPDRTVLRFRTPTPSNDIPCRRGFVLGSSRLADGNEHELLGRSLDGDLTDLADALYPILVVKHGRLQGRPFLGQQDIPERAERDLDRAGPAALLVTALAGWPLAGATLRPVEQMRREAAAISASEPGRRLPVPATGDELARLASTLNEMLDRLQEALERERRFVDDASHELRTPLATLRAEIDLALARRRDAPDLEAALRSAQEDVHHMQRLADDLLVLARSRGGRVPVQRTRMSLRDLVARSVRSVRVQAEAAGTPIVVDAADETVEVDPDRVEQALRNLLENAIRHSPRGGVVSVEAKRDDGMVRIVIGDSGPGFPAGLLATAFEPFTSGASSGERGSGIGLGLAIVRAVAEAHGGSVAAENVTPGARVTLSLRA